ncbi:MAG: pyruvate formate lyase-activating protein [Ruminococcus sp.]|nr:pyruvate formate lyase-activating protein [Ruminococcus sp.]
MAEINNEVWGYVHSLESFGSVDGPGVRFVVFLQGCAMRCQFCHNPETWEGRGKQWTAKDLYNKVKNYRKYWGKTGGITVSGGEPLLQMGFVTEFFKYAKQQGIHTAIDTAGQPFSENPQWLERFENLMQLTDLVLLDLKDMDETAHKKLTGVSNKNILKMARWLSDHGKPMWIRHVLVPGLTDREDDLNSMHEFISSLKTVERVEVLPYHTLGLFKWDNLGIDYPLKGIPSPTEEQVERANKLLHTDKYSK